MRSVGARVHLCSGPRHVPPFRERPAADGGKEGRRSGHGDAQHAGVPHRLPGSLRGGSHADHDEPDLQTR